MKTQHVGVSEFESTLAAAKRGDASALDQLFRSFGPGVHRMVHRQLQADVRVRRPWLSSMFSTADIVQEVLFSILRDLRDFEGEDEGTFESYLVTLTRHRLLDAVRFFEAVRRDQRRQVDLDRDVVDCVPGPERVAVQVDELRRFHESLTTIRPRDQALLRGRLEDGEPFADLAERLGYASADSARKCFHVAMARILARLGCESLPVGGGSPSVPASA